MNLKDVTLKNFVELNNKEKLIILSWRNNEIIRKWMYNSEIILEKNHMKFISNLDNDRNNQYFLVKSSIKNIGVIYFNNINDDSVEMGIYGNPNIKGTGKILMKNLIDYAFNVLKVKKIISEVYAENIKAYNLYKDFNFQDIKNIIKEDKTIKHMELNNENR